MASVDEISPDNMNLDYNREKLQNRVPGQRFHVINNRLELITRWQDRLKYFFCRGYLNDVRTVISQVVSRIDSDDPKLRELFFYKLNRLTPRIFDRNAISENLEPALIELLELPKQKESKEKNATNYVAKVNSVRLAMALGIPLELCPMGSSGAYFGKDIRNKRVIVFKPFDEGPFGPNTPKRCTRVLRKIQGVFIKLGCNLGRKSLRLDRDYLAEVWTSKIDKSLGLGVVPETRLDEFRDDGFYGPNKTKKGSCQLYQHGMVSAEEHFASVKEGSAKEVSQAEQEKIAIIGFITGNQDQSINNWGVVEANEKTAKETTAVSFDNGLSFPHIHSADWLSTRNQYLWASLPFAKMPFCTESMQIIEKLYKEQDVLIRELEAVAPFQFDHHQKMRMRERIAVLYHISAEHPEEHGHLISELGQIKTNAQFQAFFKEHRIHVPLT